MEQTTDHIEDQDAKTTIVETTIGDLICAIRDAAEESVIGEEELSSVTHAVLLNLLEHQQFTI